MAIHANGGVIGVAAYATVMRIRIRLVGVWRISRVAGADTGENRVVGGVDMAIGARRTLVRNPEVRMVEYRTQPGCRHISRVAAYASCWVRGGYVIRHVRAISLRVGEISLVATVAIRRRIARRVVAAQMAIRTRVDHRADGARNRRTRWQHV